MRSPLGLLALFAVVGAGGALLRPAHDVGRALPVRHVVAISVDGLMPGDLLDPGGSPLPLPSLAALEGSGVSAEALLGVYPSLTNPSYATLATGVRPARHGIFQNTLFDPLSGSSHWRGEASALRSPAVWDRAREAGLTTAAVTWPVTVGARIDALIPAIQELRGTEPWLDRLRRSSTPGLVDAVVADSGVAVPFDYANPVTRDRFSAAAAAHIVRTRRPQLLLVRFVEVDWARHARGLHGPAVDAALQRVDAHVGEVVSAVRRAGLLPSTAFVVVGDHGLRPIHAALQPNVLLRRAGLLQTDAGGRIRSWQAAAQWGAIHLADPTDRALAARVRRLFQAQAGPGAETPGLFHLIEREELDALGADPEALFYLEPTEGYVVDDQFVGDDFIAPAPVLAHNGFRPDADDMHGSLVLSGAGLRRGVRLPSARAVDLAPTVAHLLGFEMPGTEGSPLAAAMLEPRND